MVSFDVAPSHLGAALTLPFFLVTALWLRYPAKHDGFVELQSQKRLSDGDAAAATKNKAEAPLTFPHVFPLLGSLPLAYLRAPYEFVMDKR